MEKATSNNVIGKVIQVAGPAVDIQFPEGQIPVIYTAIRITSDGFDAPTCVPSPSSPPMAWCAG
jgi:hypothetical protein